MSVYVLVNTGVAQMEAGAVGNRVARCSLDRVVRNDCEGSPHSACGVWGG